MKRTEKRNEGSLTSNSISVRKKKCITRNTVDNVTKRKTPPEARSKNLIKQISLNLSS